MQSLLHISHIAFSKAKHSAAHYHAITCFLVATICRKSRLALAFFFLSDIAHTLGVFFIARVAEWGTKGRQVAAIEDPALVIGTGCVQLGVVYYHDRYFSVEIIAVHDILREREYVFDPAHV